MWLPLPSTRIQQSSFQIGLWNSRNTFFANESVSGTRWKICSSYKSFSGRNHFPVGATKLAGFSAGKREGEEAIWRHFEHFEHFESNSRYRSQPWSAMDFFGSQVGRKISEGAWCGWPMMIHDPVNIPCIIFQRGDTCVGWSPKIWYYLHHFAGFTVSHLLVHQVGTSALRSQAAEGEPSAHVAKALVEVVPDDVGCSKYICL